MVKVVREGDKQREVWEFWYTHDIRSSKLRLTRYTLLTRPTWRHKWKESLCLTPVYSGERSIHNAPLPDEVIEAAKQQFVAMLEVGR